MAEHAHKDGLRLGKLKFLERAELLGRLAQLNEETKGNKSLDSQWFRAPRNISGCACVNQSTTPVKRTPKRLSVECAKVAGSTSTVTSVKPWKRGFSQRGRRSYQSIKEEDRRGDSQLWKEADRIKLLFLLL